VQLASILTPRREDVSLGEDGFSGWTPITIHFDGVIEPRDLRGKEGFKGRLFAVYPGDLVFSKIDARNGAIGLLPASIPQAMVTAEYPVYSIDEAQVEPEYLALLLRTGEFRRRVNDLVSGTSGRKRVEPEAFVGLGIPLPPLETQRAIVARWQQAQAEVKTLEQQAIVVEEQSRRAFEAALGLAGLRPSRVRRLVTIVVYRHIDRWSPPSSELEELLKNAARHYPIVQVRSVVEFVQHGTGHPPASNPTSLRVLKINAVTKGELDISEHKWIDDKPELRERFSLQIGDVLMCRTNGSLRLVGMPVVVEDTVENCVFPDKVFRVRCTEDIIPHYLAAVLKSPLGRMQIESAARTAVGNHAIGTSDILRFRIPLPPLDVQRDLVLRVEESRAEVTRLRAQAAHRAQEAQVEIEAAILGSEDLPGF